MRTWGEGEVFFPFHPRLTLVQGYDADHPYIDLLRLRNFTIGQKISDEDILGPRGLDRIIELVKAMHLFVSVCSI